MVIPNLRLPSPDLTLLLGECGVLLVGGRHRHAVHAVHGQPSLLVQLGCVGENGVGVLGRVLLEKILIRLGELNLSLRSCSIHPLHRVTRLQGLKLLSLRLRLGLLFRAQGQLQLANASRQIRINGRRLPTTRLRRVSLLTYVLRLLEAPPRCPTTPPVLEHHLPPNRRVTIVVRPLIRSSTTRTLSKCGPFLRYPSITRSP